MGNQFHAWERTHQHREEGKQNTSKRERTWEMLQKPGTGDFIGIEMVQ